MYFVKNSATQFIKCKRHRIKIPTLGFVQLEEKGYIPLELIIKNGTVSKKAELYYVSALVEVPNITPSKKNNSDRIGIDLGLTEFAIYSDGKVYKNVNKTHVIKKIGKKLRRLQRQVSRKYENNKRGKEYVKTSNIIKVEKKIQLKKNEFCNIL